MKNFLIHPSNPDDGLNCFRGIVNGIMITLFLAATFLVIGLMIFGL